MIISRRGWYRGIGCAVCGAAPFARWHYANSDYTENLCQRDLDIWLDNADAEPLLEPDRLEFLWGEFRDLP